MTRSSPSPPPSPTLTLYLLCQFPKTPMSFAPHGWKTLLDLRLLDVPHQVEYVTLAALRGVLPGRFGLGNVTLPALVASEEGCADKVMLDSYHIAQYLEKNYSRPGLSIYGPEPTSDPLDSPGRQFAEFIEQWVDRSLAAEIRPCVLHSCYATFPSHGPDADTPSRLAFLAKCGQPRLDELTRLNSDAEWTAKQNAGVRKELGTLEVMLAQMEGDGEVGVFLGGRRAAHADFCVFAFYAYSRSNAQLTTETWHSPDLPQISKWIQGFVDSGLVEMSELPAM